MHIMYYSFDYRIITYNKVFMAMNIAETSMTQLLRN